MQPLKIVLDTNVVLDWLLFKRPDMQGLWQAIRENRIAVITSPAALDELQRVLAYPQLEIETARQQEILALYQGTTIAGAVPEGFSRDNLFVPERFPRCKDRSDEHFVALAYHAGAHALISHDKAVLKMGKRTKKLGLRIIAPKQLADIMS
jgi:putative PIN family toxin of toxin-antitoxin system